MVRGTDAAVGSSPAHSGRVWTVGGEGDELRALTSHFRSNTNPLPMYVASLNYPASGGVNYFGSISQGRATLVNELNWIVGQCGFYHSPNILLAGHSQGAAVVLETLIDWPDAVKLSAMAKGSIKGVVAFGDPNFAVGQPFNAPGSPTNAGGVMGPRLQVYNSQLASYRVWGWPMESPSPDWQYRVRSYCYAGDFFCNSGTGPNAMAIHNSYGELSTSDAATWMEYQVESFD